MVSERDRAHFLLIGQQYALIGGHAVNVWLEPRFTADIDVTVQAGRDSTERLEAAATDAGLSVLDEHGATAS